MSEEAATTKEEPENSTKLTTEKKEAKPVAEATTENAFEVTLKTLTGDEYKIEVSQGDPVVSLREKLCKEIGCPITCVRLVKGSTMLRDDAKTLADYGIVNSNIKLKAIIRLMNVITESYVQGKWYWAYQGSRGTKMTIEDGIYDNGVGKFQFTITEEGFGFKGHLDGWGEIESIWKPESINPDVIKITHLTEGKIGSYFGDHKGHVSFWVREFSAQAVDIIHKEWSDANSRSNYVIAKAY